MRWVSIDRPRAFSSSSVLAITVSVFRPRKSNLHETGFLRVLIIELRDRHFRARIAIERHEFVQRPVADDDARRMRRGVAVEALDLLPIVKKR